MDHDDRRKRPVTLGRPRQVELELRRASLGVDDVLLGRRLGRLGSRRDHRAETKDSRIDGAIPTIDR